MLKDYSKDKFISFDENKCFRIIHKLIRFIESDEVDFESKHFSKLKKYHEYLLEKDCGEFSNIVYKEFQKVQGSQRQFQIYISLLERIIGNSSKEYDFLMNIGDNEADVVKFPIVCFLDGIRSVHNIGAIIRNCECLGVERVVIKDPGLSLNLEKISKTAMGSENHIDCDFVSDLQDEIVKYKLKNYLIISLDTGKEAIDIKNIPRANGYVLILGHEQFGVDLNLLKESDVMAKIPLRGKKNSLNVAVASGIALDTLGRLFGR